MAANKYSGIISKLFTGDSILLKLEEGMNPETLRTSLSKEKTRQEESLRAFEIPVPLTRLRFKRIGTNGTYKVYFEEFNLGFELLTEAPREESDGQM